MHPASKISLQTSVESIYNSVNLPLGNLFCSIPPLPHCTIPILCWAVSYASIIHETIIDTCTFPTSLHPHSRDLFLSVLARWSPSTPCLSACWLIYLPLKPLTVPPWVPTFSYPSPRSSQALTLNYEFSPASLLVFPCLPFLPVVRPDCVLLSTLRAQLHFQTHRLVLLETDWKTHVGFPWARIERLKE